MVRGLETQGGSELVFPQYCAWWEVVTATQEPDGQSVVSIRRWRAIALISLATIVSVAASVGYLHLTLRPTAKRASPGISPQELGTTDFVTYDFISPSVGWALDFPTTGFSPTSPIASPLPIVSQSPGGGRFVVFRTVDGARNWKKQLTGQTSFGGFSPNSMHFLDKAHGFIAISGPTDQLYRTTDGGAHWVQLPLPSLQIGAITFSDASNGWLSSFASASSPVSRLFATHDAGDSWQGFPIHRSARADWRCVELRKLGWDRLDPGHRACTDLPMAARAGSHEISLIRQGLHWTALTNGARRSAYFLASV